ncbi:hypothetical protein HUU42_08765 [bacterium]|nr:hypothetical protein [bacterium]
MSNKFYFCSLLIVLIASCSDKDNDGTDINPPEKYKSTVVVDKVCTEPDSALTLLVTIKDSSNIPVSVNFTVSVRVYWWLSCSEAGLSDWSTSKIFGGTTGANGQYIVKAQFGASSFVGANYKHYESAIVTVIEP